MYWAMTITGFFAGCFRRGNGREFYILKHALCATFAAREKPCFRRETSAGQGSVIGSGGGFPDGHPFGPDRHAAFFAEFPSRGVDRRVRLAETRAATRAELESFHT